ACPLKDEIERTTNAALGAIGATKVDITWGAMVRRSQPRQAEQLVPGVKNIIAVASGKGGVGKSTVSVNHAVALAQAGASVGLLDADITGPNVPLMLGLEGQPKASANNKITPLERYGVKAISIQFFVPEGQPIVWRGPLVGGAIQQFLRDVDWGDLDYLVIDLPPGTSDAQLTLAQAVPISGAVLVTTPQEVSLADVGKALAMFTRMSVPVIGLVENMTAFVCPHCDEVTEIFGRGGGERFAATHELPYLGGIPLDITVRQGGDVGVPAVAQREPGPAARAMTAIAQAVAARMSVRAAQAAAQPVLTIS
ncbi:MAG: ATP-binding protein involved in chromosome partitioning, partial [Chloroflexota bacterium]|nr:ATP-binding protein involved in chromosome partitioning [Chloroflexota bacterium]